MVTDIGHVLLVDLCLDDLSCSQSELEASGETVTTSDILSIWNLPLNLNPLFCVSPQI